MSEHFDATDAAASTAAFGGTGVQPKQVSVAHYGPDGSNVATTGTAHYASSPTGTAVSYASALAGGAPYSTSTVAVDSSGRATSAATTLLASDGSVSRLLNTDYSGLTYNAVGGPVSGSVKLTVHDNETLLHDAEMEFDSERYKAYHVTSYAPADGTTVTGTTHFDYADVTLIGTRIVGGQLALQYVGPDDKPKTSSVSHLNQAGVPTTVESTNFAADGTTPRVLVASDYRGIAFGALRQISRGQLLISTQTPAGDPMAKSVFTYDHGRLIGRKPFTEGMDIPQLVMAEPAAVPGPPTPTSPADTTSEVKRPDGSLLQTRQTWHTPGSDPVHPTPRRMMTTTYALDGRTVVRLTDTDYGGATFDSSGAPNGGTVVSTQYVGGVRSSVTHIQY